MPNEAGRSPWDSPVCPKAGAAPLNGCSQMVTLLSPDVSSSGVSWSLPGALPAPLSLGWGRCPKYPESLQPFQLLPSAVTDVENRSGPSVHCKNCYLWTLGMIFSHFVQSPPAGWVFQPRCHPRGCLFVVHIILRSAASQTGHRLLLATYQKLHRGSRI